MSLSSSQFNPPTGKESRTEEPSLFAICSDGHLMPSVFVRWHNGNEILRPIGSNREYSFPPERVISRHEGEALLLQERVRGVVANYSFKIVAHGVDKATGQRFKVVRCAHPTNKKRVYFIKATATCAECPCEAFKKSGFSCKHIGALRQLEAELPEEPTAPASAPVTPAVKPTPKFVDSWQPGEEW